MLSSKFTTEQLLANLDCVDQSMLCVFSSDSFRLSKLVSTSSIGPLVTGVLYRLSKKELIS